MNPEVHSLTGAYACDALEPAERAAFERHLAVCPTCAQEVAELSETVAVLALAAAEEPPARLRAAVDAQIAVTRQVPPKVSAASAEQRGGRWAGRRTGSGPGRGTSRRGWNLPAYLGWGVAAAMACLVAILGVRLANQQNRLDQADSRSAAIASLLAAPDMRTATGVVSTGGKALVMVSHSRNEAAISLPGAEPPAGKVLQLWMIGPEGVRSAGVVPAGRQGSVIAHGLGDTQTIGVTVEPIGGSSQPTTTPVLLMPMPA